MEPTVYGNLPKRIDEKGSMQDLNSRASVQNQSRVKDKPNWFDLSCPVGVLMHRSICIYEQVLEVRSVSCQYEILKFKRLVVAMISK